MNANELAYWLDAKYKRHGELEDKYAATMLRQQHKELEHMWMANTVLEVEIEALKAKTLTDEEIHQAIRRGFARDGFLSDGIFLEIKELLRNTQGVNSEQVPDFFFMENDLMGKR